MHAEDNILCYLADHLIPASDAAHRRRCLWSINLKRLTVPHCRLSTYGCRAFHYVASQSGTHCQMNLEMRTVLTLLNSSWKQFSYSL